MSKDENHPHPNISPEAMRRLKYRHIDQVFAFPVWVYTRIILMCLKEHVWKASPPSLSQWAFCRTNIVRLFDLIFWLAVVNLTILVFRWTWR